MNRLLILVFTVFALSSSALAQSSMFRGNLSHTGVFNTKGVAGPVEVKWKFETRGPIRSSPVIYDGLIFFGSSDGNLYAIAAETGQLKWRFDAARGIQSTPAVSDNLVYFSSGDGIFRALDARTGREVWRHVSTNSHYEGGWDYYASSAAVASGAVYFGSGDTHIYALDARTGKEKWKFKTEGMVRSSPAIVDGTLYCGSNDGNLYAIDQQTGQLRWKFKTQGNSFFPKGEVQSSPAISEGVIAFGSRDYRLYTLDIQTGKERWNFEHANSWVVTSPVIHNGAVYAGSSDGRFFHAVDLKTGRERWRFKTESNVLGSPAYVDGLIYFGCFDSHLFALDAETGTEKWKFKTGDSVMSSPLINDGVIYFGSDDGSLYALRSKTQPATPSNIKRAVFWDGRVVFKWFSGHEKVRDYLVSHGYETLTVGGLTKFLKDRISDRAPSVVVFAIDTVPQMAAGDTPENSLLRQYLNAGGKVVWLGIMPFAIKRNPDTGLPVEYDPKMAEKILGMKIAEPQGAYRAAATKEGREWGLPEWFVADGGVDPKEVTTVLATNENGRAVVWVKNYGGREGTGFVYLWARREPIENLEMIRKVAEYGL
ncbi:MAG: PQQ-binding-like beta-propeller repeat protein [Acidobacteriota bacterium]